MCIRDRLNAAHDPEAYGQMVQESHSILRIADLVHSTVPENCLLYTSDAADERSSVDLGGRRIIKKKKNRSYDYTDVRAQQKRVKHITKQ